MMRGEYALKVADNMVIPQIIFGIVRERVAFIQQNLAAPVNMDFLKWRRSLWAARVIEEPP